MAANERRYPDLKYKYIRGLLDHERHQRKKHWLKSAAEWTSKAIVSLELHQASVKTVKQASNLEGIGRELSRKLAEIEQSCIFSAGQPNKGFISSAPAILVSLYIVKLQAEKLAEGKLTRVTMGEGPLCNLASTICEESFINLNDENDVSDDGSLAEDQISERKFCMAWWRMVVLINRNLVKKRSVDKQPVYELLADGEVLAKQLKDGAGIPDSIVDRLPEIPVHTVPNFKRIKTPRKRKENDNEDEATPKKKGTKTTVTKNKKKKPTEEETSDFLQRNLDEETLYIRDSGSDGLILLFDTQELGGGRMGLGEIARLLDKTDVRYRSKKLEVGDYVWIWRSNGQQVELPFLIERKRADDLARSLLDGRYESQKEKMLQWKQKLKKMKVDATLKYLVEGDPRQYVVKCGCGCGGVLKCGWPTAQRLEKEIDVLDRSKDFELIRTKNISETVGFLAVVDDELQMRVDRGEFDVLLQVQQNVVITDDEESNENPEIDNTVPRDKNSIIVIDDSPPDSPGFKTEWITEEKDEVDGAASWKKISDSSEEKLDYTNRRKFELETYHCAEDDFLSPASKWRTRTPKQRTPLQTGGVAPKENQIPTAPLCQYHSAKSSPAMPKCHLFTNAISNQESIQMGRLPHRGTSFDTRENNNSDHCSRSVLKLGSSMMQKDDIQNVNKNDQPKHHPGRKSKSSRQLFMDQPIQDASLSPVNSAYSWSKDASAPRSPVRVSAADSPSMVTSAYSWNNCSSQNSKNASLIGLTFPSSTGPKDALKYTSENNVGITKPRHRDTRTEEDDLDCVLKDDTTTEVQKTPTERSHSSENGSRSAPSLGRNRSRKILATLPKLDDDDDDNDDRSNSGERNSSSKPFNSVSNVSNRFPRFDFSGVSGPVNALDSDSDDSLPDIMCPTKSTTNLGKTRLESLRHPEAKSHLSSVTSQPAQLTEQYGIRDYATEDKINTIKGILPDISRDRIRDVLIRNVGNVESCISVLLDN